jgi:hypothetical protein
VDALPFSPLGQLDRKPRHGVSRRHDTAHGVVERAKRVLELARRTG